MRPTKQPAWLAAYAPVCEAIAALLHPYGEVAVHDIASDRIVAIWNPYSRRRPGDPSLLDELGDLDTVNGMIGPYDKVGAQGQRLTSVSALLVDAEGQARGLLCVNFDRSPFDGVAKLVTEFAAAVTKRPPELFSRDWRVEISLLVDEECRRRGLRRDSLTRADRLALVKALDEKGLFATRNAVTHAAHTLGVSRATVYKLLKEARS